MFRFVLIPVWFIIGGLIRMRIIDLWELQHSKRKQFTESLISDIEAIAEENFNKFEKFKVEFKLTRIENRYV